MSVSAVVVAGVAILAILGVGHASSAPPPGDQGLCQSPWRSVPATSVFGDPVAVYSGLGGTYEQSAGVAYKLTGQFPHATSFALTGYNDYGFLSSRGDVLDDSQVIPDRGSLNPFRSGNPVEAGSRSYTAWLWPASVPVPRGLKNVVLFPTTHADPTDQQIRTLAVLRLYQMQPGYALSSALPTVHAVSAADPTKGVPCPVTQTAANTSLLGDYSAWRTAFGPAQVPPEPSDSRVLFSRPPYQFIPFPESYPAHGSTNYLSAALDTSKITVVTWHKTASYFNNQVLTPSSLMGDFQTRYMSITVFSFPESASLSVNSDDAIYRQGRAWVTVLLPSDPSLSPAQLSEVRAKAARLRYNVIQDPPPASLFGIPTELVVRQNMPSGAFCGSITNVPSWTDPNNPATANNNYRDFGAQNSAKFFATYTSNSENMGPYWIDGVKETFQEFMSDSPGTARPSSETRRVTPSGGCQRTGRDPLSWHSGG